MNEPPACPGPDPKPRLPSRFTVPPGAVDTHAHVIGEPPRHKLAPNARYRAPEATMADYLAMLDATGMAYGVLVQVSVHGTDNSLMLDALRANRARLRGVAVVDPAIPPAECRALAEAGVVGLRINSLYGGGKSFADIERYGAICREMGWHLQLFLDAHVLPEIAATLAAQNIPVVFDHIGLWPPGESLQSPGFQTLLAMVRDGAWVKLSGAYRYSEAGFPYTDTTPLARAVIEAGAARCVWGSDWPHVATHGHMPNVADLLDLLADWAPDETIRRRILSDNPRRLYGFGE